MPIIGYHASHEQHAPGALRDLAVRAAGAGFNAISCSDHFRPWIEEQGHSGYSWAWLGAALEATSSLPEPPPFSVVCAPGYRYPPAVFAQAAATLAEMYPGRFAVALGSGEALNESVLGERWPAKAERNARLLECAEIIRRLLAGETVTHHGLVRTENARLYTLPEVPPLLFGAAVTPATARWLGGWADGLLTVTQGGEKVRRVVEGFREGGGENKPMLLQVKVAYDRTDDHARRGAHEQWRGNIFDSSVLADLPSPAHFAAAAEYVTPEDVAKAVRVSSDAARHAAWLHEDLALGFDGVYVHNVVREQARFIDDFGERVLPQLHD